jgi:predicted N-acetyltransferase YhbS
VNGGWRWISLDLGPSPWSPPAPTLAIRSERDDVAIRAAVQDDAGAIADVYLASFRDRYDFPLAHTDEQVRHWIREILLPQDEVWVATDSGGSVVALMALTSNMVAQLYVAPGWTGRGIGSRLITLAKARRPDGLELYTFLVNVGARRFYARHGFDEVERGDGSGNEEGQPDVRFAWRPGVATQGAGAGPTG